MNNELTILLTEFLINYWLHSSLFVGVALIAFKMHWLSADKRGERIAKLALFAGVFTSIIFVADWRVFEKQQAPLEMNWQLKEKQQITSLSNALVSEDLNKQDSILKFKSVAEVPVAKPISQVVSPASQWSIDLLLASLKGLQWQLVLIIFWLVVSLSIVFFKLFRISQLHWLLEKRQLVSDEKVVRIYSNLAQRLQVSSSVKLLESENINSPIVFGQYEVVLPIDFSKHYESKQIEAALAHEIAHLKRKDSFWQKLFVIFNCLFFFQALNKLLVQKLYQIAEQQSDQLACQWTGNSHALAEALAITAHNHFNASQNQWVPAMKSNKSQLLIRVEALISKTPKSSSLTSVAFGTLIVLFVLTAMPGLSITQAQATSFGSDDSSHIDINNGKVKHMNMSHSQDGLKIKIKAKLQDDIKFNDSDTAITKFPEDSRLDIIFEKDGDDDRRLLIERKNNEEVIYNYYVDGDKKDFERNGKQWFASVLPQIFRMTGLDAKERVARIQKKGRDSAVLDEVELIRSDYIQRVYMKELFRLSQLSRSDAYRSLELSQNIQSDFEMAGVLKAFVITQKPSDKNWKKLFKVSQDIQSDFELAGLLKTTVSHISSKGDAQDYFFDAAESIQSDFEMRGLFSHFLTEKDVSETFIVKMLLAAKNISSDFELASLLIQANQQAKMNDDIFEAYLNASKEISSDFEMSRTFISLLDNKIKKVHLIELIDMASDHISSDFELARFLISVVDKQSIDEESKAVLLGATDSLSSDFEQNRVLRRIKG